jgi:hypothetical protein
MRGRIALHSASREIVAGVALISSFAVAAVPGKEIADPNRAGGSGEPPLPKTGEQKWHAVCTDLTKFLNLLACANATKLWSPSPFPARSRASGEVAPSGEALVWEWA